MQITVSGKQVELSDALRERVSHELTGIAGKYFGHAQDARVTFTKSRLGFSCDIDLHARRGLTLRGEAEAAGVGGGTIRLFPDFSPKPTPETAMAWETRGAAPLVMTGMALATARQAVEYQAKGWRVA
ncbi:MAG: ribosome-associated translation inhibitor RaiA [Acetobacteraceae bacterium]|nr:ribosome-associated translation inhibitor RaiA [Acetobacteraceae bacterium]